MPTGVPHPNPVKAVLEGTYVQPHGDTWKVRGSHLVRSWPDVGGEG